MTLRTRLVFLVLALPGTAALAHDGDHAGMTESSVQLHHLGVPIVVLAITLAILVVTYFKRSDRRDVNVSRRK